MEKEVQASFMHRWIFGERESFANKTSQSLPECIVPTFHMSRFPSFLSDSHMLLFWDHGLSRLLRSS
jgi:hypothetical protein